MTRSGGSFAADASDGPANGERQTQSSEHGRSPWVGVDPDVDPVSWARLLRRAHELTLSKGKPPPILRELVVRSWRRAASAGVDPDRPAPKMLDGAETARTLEDHPLGHLLPLIEAMLAEATDDAGYLAVLSDANGMLLWAGGHPKALETAVSPGFLPGHLCSEGAVGTNAVGTALALDHPVQIFSAEHFNRLLHGWTCSAAPIHDPETHEILGALDLSGGFRTGHPHSLSLVSAVARVVEDKLAEEMARRDELLRSVYLERIASGGGGRSAVVTRSGRVLAASPRGWLGPRVEAPLDGDHFSVAGGIELVAEPIGDGGGRILRQDSSRRRDARPRRRLRLEALGRRRARVRVDRQSLELGPRHGEIVTLLVLYPDGLSSREIGTMLYGPGSKAVTVRAEMSRLRRRLGPLLLRNPYRLDADVEADFLEVERTLERGRVADAVDLYAGVLLPGCELSEVAAARERIAAEVRSCVLAGNDPEPLYVWIGAPAGRRDRDAHRRLLALLDCSDARRELVAGRLEALGAAT